MPWALAEIVVREGKHKKNLHKEKNVYMEIKDSQRGASAYSCPLPLLRAPIVMAMYC